MAKAKTVYACSACGARSAVWKGQCPSCQEWNTLQELEEPRRAASRSGSGGRRNLAVPVSLTDLSFQASPLFSGGLPELDELLGGGLPAGGTVLAAGEPGIGKSTLLLQLVGAVAARGGKAVYFSAEEGLPQLAARANRLGVNRPELKALASTNADDAMACLHRGEADLLVVDSVQTVASPSLEGLPGSPSQVRTVASELSEAARAAGACLILVGHVTKEGSIAGPKLLEHMVDTVLSLEGDRKDVYRVLRVVKNRFGPAQEILVFTMTGQGMEPVQDPATLFLTDRDPKLSGTAAVMAVDGGKAFGIEAQALVSRSWLPSPRRTGLGFDVNRLHLLLAVIEKRLQMNLAESDVYAKIGGGLRMADPGLDLGLVAALLSSFYDAPLPERAVCWGEVDLNGRVRPVAGQDVRLKQAQKLGMTPVCAPGTASLDDLRRQLFGKGGTSTS